MKILSFRNIAVFLLLFLAGSAVAAIRLPKLISDGMVLQRDAKLKVWGWSAPGEKVMVEIAGQELTCKANEAGEWAVQLPPQKAGGIRISPISTDSNLFSLFRQILFTE